MHFVPINYSDPDFDRFDLTKFWLLIILNQDTFSYAVSHPVTHWLIYVSTGNTLSGLWEPQESPEVLGSSYQKIVVAIETNSFCLVPDAVFTPEKLLGFAAFLSVKEADVILKDQIENGQNTVIFTFPEELIRKIETRFNSPEIAFAPKGWIKTVFEARLSGQNLYLFLKENQLQVLFPDQDKIRFYNQFVCSTADEVVYFTALVANQLQLKPEETTLIISGRVEADSGQVLRLKEFFKEVVLFGTTDYKQINTLAQHQIADFLGLS